MARQERFLPPHDFWKKAKSLMLGDVGRIAVVLPIDRMGAWEELAQEDGFHLHRKCWVKGNAASSVSRVMLEWISAQQSKCDEMEVVVEDERGVLNASYQGWTKSFLLEK